MAADHPDLVEMALKLKKVGNDIVNLVGGREIHPINVRVGGFYRVPTKAELLTMVPELEWARDAALETVRWVSQLPIPKTSVSGPRPGRTGSFNTALKSGP